MEAKPNEDNERSIQEELTTTQSDVEAHYLVHQDLAEQFGLKDYFDSFASSVQSERELLVGPPNRGSYKFALRWDFEELGTNVICKEVGFWVIACDRDRIPHVGVPGTQHGRSRYPSRLYSSRLMRRPHAIFEIWGNRATCTAAFKSGGWGQTKGASETYSAGIRDNLVKLEEFSRRALRRALAIAIRHPRFIRNPLEGFWYPVPRQDPLVASYSNVRYGDFQLAVPQFRVYLEHLDRSTTLEQLEFQEALHRFGIDTGIISHPELVTYLQERGVNNVSMNSERSVLLRSPIGEVTEDLSALGDERAAISDEEFTRYEEEVEHLRIQEEVEEERRRGEEEEEEEMAAIQMTMDEEEEHYREPSHDHCVYDEEREMWVTEKGEPCEHGPD